ncbi:MAG: putative transcriptional regulator [Frankiales bacterium]|nr:putative transcriptional regulator [Frankiales bacterium]
MPPSRSAASALLLVRLGLERGLAEQQLLAGTGLSLDDLRRPGAEVDGSVELSVISRLVALVDDPGLAVEAGTRYHLTTYGIWGFALASSPTVRSALEVGFGFVDLSFTFCRLVVEEDDVELRLVLEADHLPTDVRDFVVLRDLVGMRTIVSELTAGSLPVRRVSFALPAPLDAGRLRQVFGVDPVFGADRHLAALDVASLELALPQADELTAAMTEAQCRALVERRRARGGSAGQVRDLLTATPGAMPSLVDVAAALAVSERTLRRRLDEEGTSYRALADEVREALAEELLQTGGLSVEQVARRLGYAETASFTHAFTRWKGLSPRAFTRAARAAR